MSLCWRERKTVRDIKDSKTSSLLHKTCILLLKYDLCSIGVQFNFTLSPSPFPLNLLPFMKKCFDLICGKDKSNYQCLTLLCNHRDWRGDSQRKKCVLPLMKGRHFWSPIFVNHWQTSSVFNFPRDLATCLSVSWREGEVTYLLLMPHSTQGKNLVYNHTISHSPLCTSNIVTTQSLNHCFEMQYSGYAVYFILF